VLLLLDGAHHHDSSQVDVSNVGSHFFLYFSSASFYQYRNAASRQASHLPVGWTEISFLRSSGAIFERTSARQPYVDETCPHCPEDIAARYFHETLFGSCTRCKGLPEDKPPQKRRERLAHSSGASTSIFVMLHSWRRGTWDVTVSSERTANKVWLKARLFGHESECLPWWGPRMRMD